MLEASASLLLLGLTVYVISAARLLWKRGKRVVASDLERYVPVDGANMSWRAISEADDARWDPALYKEDPSLFEEDDHDDVRRLRPIGDVLGRESFGGEENAGREPSN